MVRLISSTAIFFAVHVAAAFAAAALVAAEANAGRRVVLLSAMLVAGAIALVFCGIALALRYKPDAAPGRWTRTAFSTIAAVIAVAVCLIYLGSYIGTRTWGGGLNYQIVQQYIGVAAPNRALFSSPQACISRSCSLSSDWPPSHFWSWRFIMPTAALASRTPRLPLLLLVLAVGWAGGTGWLTSTVARAGLLTREPLVGFFLESDELFSFSQYSRSRQMPEEAARARAEYPRGQTFQKKNVGTDHGRLPESGSDGPLRVPAADDTVSRRTTRGQSAQRGSDGALHLRGFELRHPQHADIEADERYCGRELLPAGAAAEPGIRGVSAPIGGSRVARSARSLR